MSLPPRVGARSRARSSPCQQESKSRVCRIIPIKIPIPEDAYAYISEDVHTPNPLDGFTFHVALTAFQTT